MPPNAIFQWCTSMHCATNFSHILEKLVLDLSLWVLERWKIVRNSEHARCTHTYTIEILKNAPFRWRHYKFSFEHTFMSLHSFHIWDFATFCKNSYVFFTDFFMNSIRWHTMNKLMLQWIIQWALKKWQTPTKIFSVSQTYI